MTELQAAATAIVKMYIANKGRPDWEFISCITPPHASDLTPEQRRASKTWRAWDRLREALGEEVLFADAPDVRKEKKALNAAMREFQATAS